MPLCTQVELVAFYHETKSIVQREYSHPFGVRKTPDRKCVLEFREKTSPENIVTPYFEREMSSWEKAVRTPEIINQKDVHIEHIL